MKTLIKTIQEKLTPDLLKKPYREENSKNPMFGHCYVATETLYHLIDNPMDFNIQYGKDERNITHWWLKDKKTNEIVDVTADQYYSQNLIPPYDKGRNASFLTNFPSKRAKKLMERVKTNVQQ